MKRIFVPLAVLAMGLVALLSNPLAAQEAAPEAKVAPATEAPAEPGVKEDAPGKKTGDAGHAKGEDHADHSHHDPLDKTHANGSASLRKVEEIRFDQAIATFVIFLLLTAILAKFAWGPISDGLDKRESGIAAMIDQARLAQEQAEAQLRSYEAMLAAAAEEARTIVSQARHDAEVARDRIQAEAKDLAAKERQRAVDDITAAKNVALQQIAERSVNTAISLASSIVRREVRPEDHDQLVTEALGQFSKLN